MFLAFPLAPFAMKTLIILCPVLQCIFDNVSIFGTVSVCFKQRYVYTFSVFKRRGRLVQLKYVDIVPITCAPETHNQVRPVIYP